MEREKGENKNLDEVEKLQLIDFSSEDDFLVDYPFRDSLEDLRLSVTFENVNGHDGIKLFKIVNPLEVENSEKVLHQREQKLSPSESLEPRRASYLRKSLAWDNAFFTCAGVLDPEELCAMNKGFKRRESFLFPGIQENLKMRRSADSESTFDSDEFSLESVEGDLFEDIRASIHRSCGTFTIASCKSICGKSASKKVNVSSQNMMKSMPPSERQSINCQRSKTIKEASLPSQILQHNARKGEYYSSPHRPPKILGRLNVVSAGQTKRVSSGYGRMENRTSKARYGQSLMVPEQSGSEDSCNFTKFSTPPTKSSSSVSLSASKSSSVNGSSFDESASTSSSKSSSSSVTRSIGSSNTKIVSSGSTSKAPLRFSGRSRSRLGNPTPTSSIHLLSMSNHSSSKSPSSSIEGWSSESSSSTSTANRKSGNLEFNLRRGTIQGLASHDQSPGCLETRLKSLPNQCTKKALREAGSVPVESTRNSRPSGLRMPSPKIGFFDEKNSMVPMVSESLKFQIGAQNTLPDLNANAIKRRPAKSRNLPESRNKLGSQQTRAPHSSTSSTRLQPSVQSQNLESTSQKTSGLRNSLQTASKVQNEISLEVDTAYCSKTRKVGNGEHDRRKVGLTSSLKTEGKRTKGILKNKMGIEGKGQKAENDNLVNAIDPVKREHKEARQEHVETNLPSICESKANLLNFEDQVNDLSRYFEVIDLGGDVMIELGGAHEHHGKPFKGERFLRGQQQDSPGMLKPSPHSLPTTVEFTPNTRTPLAEKNSVCNKSGSFGMKIELAQEKPVDKASSTFPSFDNAEKENS